LPYLIEATLRNTQYNPREHFDFDTHHRLNFISILACFRISTLSAQPALTLNKDY